MNQCIKCEHKENIAKLLVEFLDFIKSEPMTIDMEGDIHYLSLDDMLVEFMKTHAI